MAVCNKDIKSILTRLIRSHEVPSYKHTHGKIIYNYIKWNRRRLALGETASVHKDGYQTGRSLNTRRIHTVGHRNLYYGSVVLCN